MKNNYIEFKKQRELGEIISDTFSFIRAEFKPFLSTYFRIVGPFLLAMVIALSFYLYYVGNTFNATLFGGETQELENFGLSFGIAFFYVITAIAVYAISQSTVLHYIKSYAQGKGITNYDTIKDNVFGSFWSFIGLGILVGISILAGVMACIIPGVYLYVPLSLSFCVLVFNKMGVSESYSYSFKLVKDEWWITFAAFFVIGIILALTTYAFSLPIVMYQWIKMGVFSGDVDAESMNNVFKDPLYILLNVLSTIIQFLLYLVSIVASAFIYFNLNEKKNFTGTYERIESLGKTPEN